MLNNDLKVLIVEDDFYTTQVVGLIAKKAKCITEEAQNGKIGYEKFLTFKPDLIISDISMPVMDGIQMCELIREKDTNVPILLVTALDDKDVMLNAIKLNINEYIIKPINPEEVSQKIEKFKVTKKLNLEIDEKNRLIKILSKGLNISEQSFVITDKDLNVIFTNLAFDKLFPKTEDKVDYNFLRIIHQINIKEFDKLIESLEESQSKSIELIALTNDGNEFWVILTAIKVINNDGNVNYVFNLVDLTKQKEIEKILNDSNNYLESKVKERTIELEIATQKAEASNKAKSLFLAKMSHELRTPLNGIIGIASILLDTDLNEKQKYFISLLKSSGNSLLKIINDLLDYTKLGEGKLKLKIAEFNIYNIFDDIEAIFHNDLSRKKLKYEVSIARNVPKELFGDGEKIKQILFNLISNSIKFTEIGTILVSCNIIEIEKEFIKLKFKVTDTGIGIPKDKYDLLFLSFSQLENDLARSYGGTGLGLIISKEFIEMMEGEITFESEVNKGTEFTFTVLVRKKLNN
jgi:PAS domain S-box-containing protein